MTTIKSDIIIIGGGLTGLAIAYFLKKKNLKINILEARPRLGGRIFTKYNENTTSQEMGATWLGRKHKDLIDLLKKLNIGVFEQKLGERAIYEPISTSPHQLVTLPPNNDPSFRIQGGSSSLIRALANELDEEHIFTNQIVQSIRKEGEELTVLTKTDCFKSSIVISTLPPNLLMKTIKISPVLPHNLQDIAATTHTWMGESIKVGLTYKTPFWKDKYSSGTIVSNIGPIPEMYDHSNYEETGFGLKGFLNGSYFSLTKEQRLEMVLKQLQKYFGEQVRDFVSYEETVWRKEPFTFVNYNTHILPHQNNGHSIYRKGYLDGTFFVAGSETADQFPGYMDGAVRSAKYIAELF